MKITTEEKNNGLYLNIELDGQSAQFPVVNLFTNKVDEKLITGLTKAAIECSRWNDLSDLEIAKNFVESLLNEKEIRELIKQLEN